MIGTTYEPKYYLWLIGLLVLAALAFYIYADAITITAPPWDFCGFNRTHIGNSFTCIAFDSDVVIIK